MKAVIAKSFERIHRSNLVGMGIIPLCFKPGEDAETHGLTGHERYTIDLPSSVSEIRPGQDVRVVTDSGKSFTCVIRFDTEVITSISLCFSHLMGHGGSYFNLELNLLPPSTESFITTKCRWNWLTLIMEAYCNMS